MSDFPIVRNPQGSFQPGLHRHIDGGLVYAFQTSTVFGTDPPESIVQFVDFVTGVGYAMPMHSETVDAWTDNFQTDVEVLVPRYTPVATLPVPTPVLLPIDVIRICLQLSTATMDLNPGWYFDVRNRVRQLLTTLDTAASRLHIPILDNADPDAGGANFTEEDHRAIYLAVANDLMLEAGLVVT